MHERVNNHNRRSRQKKPRGRGPVRFLDRQRKAQMIEAILADYLSAPVRGNKILDIGSGNGGISEYFNVHNEVFSVDVQDVRVNPDNGIPFVQVSNEHLPFEDNNFDIVLSHHVIEHVGDQSLHLNEIRRVLMSDGICYMATPNKSSPVMEGHVGNEKVLRYRSMQPLFESAKFQVNEYALKVFTEPEKYFCEISVGQFFPAFMIKPLKRFFPSHMFVLKPIF
jgi:ubiquinone/menaquinone biosynthesis C-methylase UbiE